MKKKVFFMMLILAGICFSCSKSDGLEDTYNLPEQTQQTRSMHGPDLPWARALISVIENKNESDYTQDYIVYSAKSEECFIFTEDEYLIASTIASAFTEDSVQTVSSNQLLNAPKKPNGRWIFGDHAKGKLGAYRVAYKLMKTISIGRNFEIRVVHLKDGSFNVYWRYI